MIARTHADSPGALFRDDVLTIGFARRFNSYKRATLLFRDPLRLAGILNDPERPVQFIFAGKAHPRDEAGKQLLQEVFRFTHQHLLSGRVRVLEDYDLAAARTLVQGCDVWLNTPRPPLEASGTSGMKAVVNGGLHLSIRDGWWAEGFQEPFGWAIGGLAGEGDFDAQDNHDAATLYNLLEEEVVPLFYRRDARGIPVEWVERMKGSIASYAPVFNTGRMVMDYVRKAYLPASRQWQWMTENGLERARTAEDWLNSATDHFESVKIMSVEEDPRTDGSPRLGITVTLLASPAAIHDLRVEAVFGRAGFDGELSILGTSRLVYAVPGGESSHLFRGEFDLPAGRAGYTVRVTAENQDLGIVAEHLAIWA